MNNKQRKTIFALSLPLAALVIITSCMGLFIPGFYDKETANWIAQSIGQDAIDLFLITPFLIITAILAAKKNTIAISLWGGVNLYMVYTFLIYCFDVHFNSLFIIYCFILGLSFYSFLYFIVLKINEPVPKEICTMSVVVVIAIYFLIISGIFYFLWLSEIIPAITNSTIPENLNESGLMTNPVEVIDLSIFLPGFFIIGLLLLKKKSIGLLFAPVFLTFFILMDITIGTLIVLTKVKGIESDYTIVMAMSILALFSLTLLVWYYKAISRGLHSG